MTSKPIGIDTCATASISGNREDFIGKLEPVESTKLRGVGGTIPIIGKGTMILHVMDDQGNKQALKIRDSYYAPRLRMRLFSPQQWSRQGPIQSDGTFGRSETTTGRNTKLNFPGGSITVKHDDRTGLPIMYTKTNTSEFAHFVQTQSMSTYEARITPTQAQIDELLQVNPDTLTPAHLRTTTIIEDPMQPLADTTKKSLNFDEVIGTDSQLLQDLPEKDKRTLLLRWHYRLGHLPFGTLINLAKQGLIDQRLATIREPPLCPGCQYGKQTRRSWCTKANKKL